MTELHKVWIEQCEAAEQIEGKLGTQQALDYLVGEKFSDFLEAAETNTDYQGEIPAFVAEIKKLFEAVGTEDIFEFGYQDRAVGPRHCSRMMGNTDPEVMDDFRKDYLRRCTRELLLMERARKWLLEE